MSELFIFFSSILVSLGEAGKYSIFSLLLILLFIFIRSFLAGRWLSLKLNWYFLFTGFFASLTYSIGASMFWFERIDVTFVLKLPVFFVLSYLASNLLFNTYVFHLVGLGIGSAIYSILCFINTLLSPYSWKIAAREFVPFLTPLTTANSELETQFINSLDPLQASCLGLSLAIVSISFYCRSLTRRNLRILWAFLQVFSIAILILSYVMDSRSALLLSFFNLLALLFMFRSLVIADISLRANFFHSQTGCVKSNLIKAIFGAIVFLAIFFSIREYLDAASLSIAAIDSNERELFAGRESVLFNGAIAIISLADPDVFSGIIDSVWGQSLNKTAHNLFLDQYYFSDLWGLLSLFAFVSPVFILGSRLIIRFFTLPTFSVYGVLFVNFFFSFLVVSMTSSPFKPTYAVVLIPSVVFCSCSFLGARKYPLGVKS